MKINLQSLWKQNQDLNFGEIQDVVRAAEEAAERKKRDIIISKFKPKKRKKVDHLMRGLCMTLGFQAECQRLRREKCTT